MEKIQKTAWSSNDSSKRRLLFLKISLGVACFLVCLLALFRKFDRDEFEAIHTAWMILNGDVIYMDFFQHHHPFFYYLLVPIIKIFGDGIFTLIATRIIIALFFFGILKLTFEIAEVSFKNKLVSWLSVLLMVSISMFSQKAIEIRPDVLQTFFALLSIFLILKYSSEGKRWAFFLSALFLGCSFLFLQKSIFVVAALGSVQLYWVLTKKWTLKQLVFYWMLFILSISPYYVYLILGNQFNNYLFWNWTINMNFEGSFSVLRTIADSFIYNHFIWVFYFIGVWTFFQKGQYELVILSLILLSSTFIAKTPYRQYFMPFVPLMSIISASAINNLHKDKYFKIIVSWIVIIACSYYGYILLKYPNKPQIAKVKWVLQNSDRSDLIYDGDIQFNLFRKDLDFFWYSTNPQKGGLITFQRLKKYHYNIYELIDKYQPKIISSAFIDVNVPSIQNNYNRSKEYPDLLIRSY